MLSAYAFLVYSLDIFPSGCEDSLPTHRLYSDSLHEPQDMGSVFSVKCYSPPKQRCHDITAQWKTTKSHVQNPLESEAYRQACHAHTPVKLHTCIIQVVAHTYCSVQYSHTQACKALYKHLQHFTGHLTNTLL